MNLGGGLVYWSARECHFVCGCCAPPIGGAELTMTEVIAEKAFISEQRPAKAGPLLASRPSGQGPGPRVSIVGRLLARAGGRVLDFAHL
jgi:hypothetical protein